LALICPTGKSPARFPIRPVQSFFQKYFGFAVGQITFTDSRIPARHKGRFAVVTKRWAADAVDVSDVKTTTWLADGESVWS
jgi:hypothetical protein